MKVEKDLGFVNEIPVYVNGKKSNLRVGETTLDAAVEGVLENTKESFQKPVTVAGQSKIYYVVEVATSVISFLRNGKIINVRVLDEYIPSIILSNEIRKIEVEFSKEINGKTEYFGYKELEEIGAVCKVSKENYVARDYLTLSIDFSGISESTEEEVEAIKATLTQMDALKIEAEQASKANLFIDKVIV